MNSLARFAGTLLAFLSASSAFGATPATNHYFGISYFQNSSEFTDDNGSFISHLENINLRYGYKMFKYLAVEGLFGFSEEKTDDSGDVSLQNDYLVGIFARGNLSLPIENVTVYGLVGTSRAKYSSSVDSQTGSSTTTAFASTTKNGVSYGAGVELFGAPNTAFHIEWTRYLNIDDTVSEGWVLGLTHYFAMPSWRR